MIASFQQHPFEPVYNSRARILILGTMPSVKSRAENFYYGHPRNRFWQVLAAVFDSPLPDSIPAKIRFLHKCRIALWDVAAGCEIAGSSDSSIRNAVPNDIGRILRECEIREIFANGKTAEELYMRLIHPLTGRPVTQLPSTSPANAAYSLDDLIASWNIIRNY